MKNENEYKKEKIATDIPAKNNNKNARDHSSLKNIKEIKESNQSGAELGGEDLLAIMY